MVACHTPGVGRYTGGMDEKTRAECRELARREVAAAPPLTEQQQNRIRAILRGRISRPRPPDRVPPADAPPHPEAP